MTSESVLGKRSGHMQSIDQQPMLDALQKLSATPGSALQPTASSSAESFSSDKSSSTSSSSNAYTYNTNGSRYKQAYPQQAYKQAYPQQPFSSQSYATQVYAEQFGLPTQPAANQKQFGQHRAYKQSAYQSFPQSQFGQVKYNQYAPQPYSGQFGGQFLQPNPDYSTRQQQHMLLPQSPPQESFMTPQSPLDDFGEKRRRVNGYDLSGAFTHKQHQQLQQQQQFSNMGLEQPQFMVHQFPATPRTPGLRHSVPSVPPPQQIYGMPPQRQQSMRPHSVTSNPGTIQTVTTPQMQMMPQFSAGSTPIGSLPGSVSSSLLGSLPSSLPSNFPVELVPGPSSASSDTAAAKTTAASALASGFMPPSTNPGPPPPPTKSQQLRKTSGGSMGATPGSFTGSSLNYNTVSSANTTASTATGKSESTVAHPSVIKPPPAGRLGAALVPAPALVDPSVTSATATSKKRWRPPNVTLPKIVDGTTRGDCDDEGGHYIVRNGEQFAGRYVIMKLLGQGTFGKVAQAWDERTSEYCAIKIIRAVPKYRDASKIELRVLAMLLGYDPKGKKRCVHIRECFDYRDHVCIVTDLYDISVYDFLKENSFLPFPGQHIRDFARQILTSVAFIHSLGLVHTDLKPENVLLTSAKSQYGSCKRVSSTALSAKRAGSVKPRRATRKELECTDVTLIDFGSAVFEDEYHSSVVSTRHYRAPEIIFGTGWSYPCDMWSIGCVLIELCTGHVLFETRDNLEHLHMMERTLCTTFSSKQLVAAANTTDGATLVTSRSWYPKLAPLVQQSRIDSVENMRTVSSLIMTYSPYLRERKFWDSFLDLVSKLMELDPEQRLTATAALEHPWFSEVI